MNKINFLFISSFIINIVIKALTFHSILSLPYTYFNIIYCFFWSLLLLIDLRNRNFVINSFKGTKLIWLLLFYFVFFGLINIQNLDRTDSIELLIRSIMFVWSLLVSVYWIRVLNCSSEIIKYTYYAMAMIMLTSFLFFVWQTDISSTISTFWSKEDYTRTRNLYGFVANNIAAEYAMSVILLSLGVFTFSDNNDYKNNALLKILNYLCNIIMFFIIITNNSRGTLLVFLFIMMLLLLMKCFGEKVAKKTVIMLSGLIIGTFLGILYYCSINSLDLEGFFYSINRYHFLDNYEILKVSKRWFLGIGRVSGGYFKNENILYGLKTNYMEMYYMNVFITSGILGTFIILYILFTIFYKLYKLMKQNNKNINKWYFVVFIYCLAISLFEQYLFDYSYVSSMFFIIFILSVINKNDECYSDIYVNKKILKKENMG